MIIFQAFMLLANSEIYQKGINGIVYIEVNGDTLGSGFFIDASGTILTNYHVIDGARNIRATSKSGNIYIGIRVISFDKNKDIAFLKINGQLKDDFLQFNTNPYKVGDKVYVFGHPLGQSFSFTDGIISKIYDQNGVEIIQTTAVVAPGSSGGPMINSDGEVIGIIHSGMSEYQGINFGTSSDSILNRPLTTTYSKILGKMIYDRSNKIAYCRNKYARFLNTADLTIYIANGKISSIGVSQDKDKKFSYCLADIIKNFDFRSNKDFTSTHQLNFY